MQKRIYLASQSPRRLELLRQIGIDAMVLPLRHQAGRADVDETPLPGERPVDYVVRVARLKAEAGILAVTGRRLPVMPILTADTTVAVDGMVLGKPATPEQAAEWLRDYAGKTHQVHSGVAIAWEGQVHVALSSSKVRFRALDEAEIAAYVESREPMDKAGGYGIQGRAAVFIEHIEGSYSGIMGLPLFETAALLKEVGISVL
ncbi:septum formation protein [Sulfuritortus calidifontis]|uniref:dTTP/UTP pyrophosphatase n=1 Tax=Sulfuritortus calidifontis TaxID=1914471 RepID=A0A4R3JVS3_9PROT|nr:Maf family protein [Sulfuritortus calidifontis]TCS72168.1 septum formation protein [Sulfuritortus calidifontis]